MLRVVRRAVLGMIGLCLACSANEPAESAQPGPGSASSGVGSPNTSAAPVQALPAMAPPAAAAAVPAGAPAPSVAPVAPAAPPVAAPPKPENASSAGTGASAMTSSAAMAGATGEAPPSLAAAAGSAAATLPRMGFAAFATANLDASLDFYKTVFKMQELMRIPLGVGMEVVLGYEDQPAQAGVIIMSTPGQGALEHGNAFSRFIFVVEDIDATVKQFQDRDLQVVSAPAAGNGFMYAIVVDPDGYRIELIQYN